MSLRIYRPPLPCTVWSTIVSPGSSHKCFTLPVRKCQYPTSRPCDTTTAALPHWVPFICEVLCDLLDDGHTGATSHASVVYVMKARGLRGIGLAHSMKR
ncbi:hypothetical protein K474DRAFT_1084636 [Panus rudis PR-1116 ss-1]|nr:hypothetical protein K474DRAFT_1084636 [Panus rudis PR-1116 ss-1]